MRDVNELHVIPHYDLVDHDAKLDCWCGPFVGEVCHHCNGEGDDCPHCIEGLIPWTKDGDVDIIVMHQPIDGRPKFGDNPTP